MGAPKGNQYAKGNKGNSDKRWFQTPEELEVKIDEYFAAIGIDNKVPTLAGLCLHLGFSGRNAMHDYGKRKEFSNVIEKALLLLQSDREQRLLTKEGFTPGVIFDLKNNYGWKDKQEVEHTVNEEAFEALDRRLAKAKNADN